MKNIRRLLFVTFLFTPLIVSPLFAAEKDKANTEALAKQLQNPVASLISIPFQNNFDSGLGAGQNGTRYTLRFQPVVPSAINKDWNLITRPILTYISQDKVFGNTSQTGLSDTQLELFLSPSSFKEGELIWGAGAIVLMPTASEAALGTEKWGVGPSACALIQNGHWSYGGLVNQLWSVAGNSARSDISQTYLQPFISHTTSHGSTVTFSSETSYDWVSHQWDVPLIAGASQILPVYGRYVSVGASALYHVESPSTVSKWGARFVITLLLPDR